MIDSPPALRSNQDLSNMSETSRPVLQHAVRIVGVGLGGAALAMVLTFWARPVWQAKVVIQNGQLYQVTAAGPATSLIEPTNRTIDRIRVTSFQNEVIRRLGLPVEENVNAETDLIRRTLDIRLLRASDLIELRAQGYSSDAVKKTLQQYTENLIADHRKVIEPTLRRYERDLQHANSDLNDALNRQALLQKHSQSRNSADIAGRFSENVLLDNMLSNNADEIRALQQRRNQLQEELNPERTFSTRMVGDIEVSREPVYPKRPLFALSGFMIGALAGLSWSSWLTARRRAKNAIGEA